MKFLKCLVVAALGAAFFMPAHAQWQVPTNAIPYGQGDGVSGFGFVGPGTNNQALFGSTGAAPNWRGIGLPDLPSTGNASSLLGNPTGSAAAPSWITLDPTLGFSGTTLKCSTFGSSQAGCVPASGGGTSNFLRADGTWTGASLPAGAVISPSKVDNICYIDGTTITSFANALTTCSSNSTIIVPSNQTFSANQTVSTNGIIVECQNNATITWSANVHLTLNANSITFRYCNIVGPGLGTPSSNAIQVNGNNFSFLYNNVSGFATSTDDAVIIANGSGDLSGLILFGNRFTGLAMRSFSSVSAGNTQHWRFANNIIDNGISVIPQTGASPNDLIITGNDISINDNSFLKAACLQIQGGNVNMRNVLLTNNHCTNFGGPTTSPGQNAWSLGGYTLFTISGNVYNANGFNFTNGGFLMEINGLNNDGVVSGNSLIGNGDDQSILVCEQCNSVMVANNFVSNTVVGGIVLAVRNNSSFSAGFIANNDQVIGNTVIMATNATGRGIDVDCENATGNCNGFMVSNNQVFNNNRIAGSIGISVRTSGAGNMTWGVISSNFIHGNATGVVVGGLANGTFCYLTGWNDGTAATSLSGTSSCN